MIEAVIAIFLLLVGFFLVTSLFHISLRYTTLTEKHVTAARLAQDKLQEIRAWARTPSNFTGGWATYDGVTVTDPESGFRIATRGVLHRLLSPCTSTESVYSAGDQREMTASARMVEVLVSWDPPSPANQLRITTLVGEPLRPLASVRVDVDVPGADPLPQGDPVTLSAHAMDTSGNEIPDVLCRFYTRPTLPTAANGSISNDRTGRTAVFRHTTRRADGSWAFSLGGQCRVRARAVVGGVERFGDSVVINLQ